MILTMIIVVALVGLVIGPFAFGPIGIIAGPIISLILIFGGLVIVVGFIAFVTFFIACLTALVGALG